MMLITFLWSLNAAIALILAAVCALIWFVDRRDTAKLMFCVLALATAVATPFELGMMQAATAAEMGEQLRWYHLPVFFILIGQLLFVRHYLGFRLPWLMWTIISLRVFVLIWNFLVDPNLNFVEISSLQHIVFLGERVSIVGESTPSAWRLLALASTLLLITFVANATIQGWRRGDSESRRKALTVGLAIIVPLAASIALNQLVVSGVLQAPICNALLFLGTLAVIGYELGRDLIRNTRARLQLAELRHEWAQVERVNSLGHLASALAHELLQPLAAIRANVDAAKLYLRRPELDVDELRSIMDDIEHDDLRAAEIIDRMRTFIKGSAPSMQAFEVQDVVQDVFSLLRHEATSRRVELKYSLPMSLPPACGDRVQVAQVILNLLINAMDAVQTRSGSVREVVLEARAAEVDTIEITVRDSGPGIPDARLQEIFNPLFTTKAAGLGVGLALSRMIVEAHGGRISAKNADTGGAVFRFTLPRAREGASLSTESGEFQPQHIETDKSTEAVR